MNETDYVFDLNRIFFGSRSWLFLVEILLRCAFMYGYALLVVRVLGKRGMGQLAPFDFVIIIALGSAVGDPMFYADVPLLHAMVAITAIILFTRGVVQVTERSAKIKDLVSTTPTRLVADGMMDLDGMHEEKVSAGELFEALRVGGVGQLGQVERAYLEPSGKISTFLYPQEEIRLGIALTPPTEPDAPKPWCGEDVAPEAGIYGCRECGLTRAVEQGSLFSCCGRCGGGQWARAVRGASSVFAQRPDSSPRA